MEVRHLGFSYQDKTVLEEMNLSFPKGKFISILGPNGSGKSTLMKLILGLLNPEKGEILIDDRSLNAVRPVERAKLMSYVPQFFQPDFDFTVEEVVAMGRYPYLHHFGDLSSNDRHVIYQAMLTADILHLKDQPITMISGGEAQRVSIARTIAQETPWIILDEPVNHLDINHQVRILRSLRELTPKRTVIAVMHDLNLARDFSDFVILMHKGKAVKCGKPGQCLNPEVLLSIYNLEFLSTYTEDGSLKYLFPRTK